MTAVDPARTIPILPSPDIEATKAFYSGDLGFEVTHYQAEQYLIVRRGEMKMHFWHTDDRALPEVSSATFVAARSQHFMPSFPRAACRSSAPSQCGRGT
jgi:catechol 2,3-dioxygenase-like lactoylglutathione lyase family enzyme